jgi:L-fuconolactonase
LSNKSLIIDSQVHSYERNTPTRPWVGFLQGPDEVTGEQMVSAMDSVGVDGALLVSPFSMYGYDPSYALEVHGKYSGKFGVIRPFDPESASISSDMEKWAATSGVAGARIMLRPPSFPSNHSGLNEILSSAAKVRLPVNMMCSGNLKVFGELAQNNPNTQLVIDHVGLDQPHAPPAPENTFSDLNSVVALASLDNVAIKISGACTLSQNPFPYHDIWEPLGQLFRAFGFERCMWGTDWTRAVELLTYEQGVEAFRVTDSISDSEKAILMGGSLTSIYKWTPES